MMCYGALACVLYVTSLVRWGVNVLTRMCVRFVQLHPEARLGRHWHGGPPASSCRQRCAAACAVALLSSWRCHLEPAFNCAASGAAATNFNC